MQDGIIHHLLLCSEIVRSNRSTKNKQLFVECKIMSCVCVTIDGVWIGE
jgi:hypothetical protein